jgi:hypothetical protein
MFGAEEASPELGGCAERPSRAERLTSRDVSALAPPGVRLTNQARDRTGIVIGYTQ